jgi:hypothetical protein
MSYSCDETYDVYDERRVTARKCGREYPEEWGEEPPPEIAALAFALPGETR